METKLFHIEIQANINEGGLIEMSLKIPKIFSLAIYKPKIKSIG